MCHNDEPANYMVVEPYRENPLRYNLVGLDSDDRVAVWDGVLVLYAVLWPFFFNCALVMNAIEANRNLRDPLWAEDKTAAQANISPCCRG
jgi:hypothetical protein